MVVKLYLQPESTKSDLETNPKPQEPKTDLKPQESKVDRTAQLLQEATSQPVPNRGRGRLRKYPLLIAMADITIYLQEDVLVSQFCTSCQKELTSLLKKGIFKIVKLKDVLEGT